MEKAIQYLDDLVWGPWMLALLLGTGCYLMLRLDLLPLKNLKYAFRCAFGSEPEKKCGKKSGERESGKVSSLASLTTELAITLGIGNIVGVATALAAGGPGAVFWMWVSAFIGMMTAYGETGCFAPLLRVTMGPQIHFPSFPLRR